MKITWKDLPQKYEEIKKHLSKETKDAYEASVGFWDMYDDPDFRPSIDDVVELINNEIKNVGNTPAPKPEPKKKPKFKVGDKVVTDHSATEVYTVVEIENGKYKLDRTSGWWSEYQLEKAKKPKKEPKTKKTFGLRCYGKTAGEWTEETDDELSFTSFKSLKEAMKEAKKILLHNKSFDYKVEIVDYDDPDKVLKTLENKAKPQPKHVNAISPAVKFIKRYASLHGKAFNAETKNRARLILAALQKSILALEIRKTDIYAKEIETIQDQLILMIKTACHGGTIEIANIDKYKEIGSGSKVNPAISLLRLYVALVGKSDVKEKAKALAVKINAADKTEANYGRQLNAALKSLNAYTSGDTSVVEADQQTLEGLYGLCGITPQAERKHSANAAELANTYFNCIHMTGKWERIIGKPSAPFKIMIYGKPGSGKSTLALQHAGYMAKNHHHNVLFVAAEEGISYTMKEKLSRLGIRDSNLTIVDELPKDLSKWDTIFIDSIQTAHLSQEDLRKLPKGKNYVYVFQTTKDGNFRGAQEYLHDVDTCIKVENMQACTEKNRFGAMGSCGVI